MTFYVALVVATILLGLSKGGFTGVGMAAMPIVTLVAPPAQAAAVLLPIIVLQDMVSLFLYRRHWDGRNLVMLLPGAGAGVALGYAFAAEVPENAVLFAVGALSVGFGLSRLAVMRNADAVIAREPDSFRGFLCGAASGFASMIAHAGSPPFQVFVIPQRMSRDTFIGTGCVFFAVVNLVKVPPFVALGALDWSTMAVSAKMAPLALAASWLGVLFVRRIAPDRFFVIVNTLLVLVGMKLAYDGLF